MHWWKLFQMLIAHIELPMVAKYAHKFDKTLGLSHYNPLLYEIKLHWMPNAFSLGKYSICVHD